MGCEVTDFSVGVKTEHEGLLWWELLFNVLAVRLAVKLKRVWGFKSWCEGQLHLLQDFWTNKNVEIGVVGASVPVVCDVTTVHDLTVDVGQISVWYLFILGQVVVKHISADSKITIVEVVES